MIRDIISDAEHKMKGAVEHAREEFAAIRTGRAHPAMFNKLMVDYYGIADAAAAAGHLSGARGAHGADQPVRPVLDVRHREGDPAIPTWASIRPTTAT